MQSPKLLSVAFPSLRCLRPPLPSTGPNFGPVTKVPEASKKFILERYGTYWSDSEGSVKTRPLPATIDDLAKMFHECKFFGYMTPEICALLLDISEFGLAEHRPTNTIIGLPVGPRFYMKFLEQIWFILFVPRYRYGISGYSPDIPYTDDWFEEAGIARDKALAEDYDPKLCKEVSRIGTAGVEFHKEVAGWQGSTLQSDLEFSQLAKAIMGLPAKHPARVEMIRGIFSR
ncbi:uncharacterized protein LACBIDRAFT_327083 [Laccaria bicolor S238N-H82]|uniref:Predicted protein n=1 Tax=Laccaria bicolor (strain S238N-H82 / ATCC MYA-4686) TaxID=486041 RepID=B0DAL2_LACBS|nr:uncharacterized protein LACBIDRAFT_327083 [Laccaria bicolor S238N-H82]EDR08770.1 predicted protein [Laccaria bicolor S238N-H82]|eukprot:XP_001880995.1 predicted protein [Laccaria bicolor S238N-H82]